MIKTPQILTPTNSLDVYYPQAHKFQDLQQKGFWTAVEIKLEKDIQPLMTELTEAEKHGILTVLKLFTLYELRAEEFWTGAVRKMFPRPEIQEMAVLFGAMELSVHKRVYQKLNELLYISNDEYYASYKENPAMQARMNFLDSYLESPDNLYKLAAFCFAEGAVLFSSFAFLMSFRANGNNKLPNIGAAVKLSLRDEDLHNQASSWLFKTLVKEMQELGIDVDYAEEKIYEMAEQVREHEYEILKEVFSKGKITGITEIQMQHFVDSRLDTCLERMGYTRKYKPKYNPIAEWFDKITEAYSYVDFFANQGSSYSRGWSATDFVWTTEETKLAT